MLGWYLQLLLVNGYFGINFNFYKLSRTLLKAETLSLDAENPMLHSPDDDSESADTSSENLPSRETKSC